MIKIRLISMQAREVKDVIMKTGEFVNTFSNFRNDTNKPDEYLKNAPSELINAFNKETNSSVENIIFTMRTIDGVILYDKGSDYVIDKMYDREILEFVDNKQMTLFYLDVPEEEILETNFYAFDKMLYYDLVGDKRMYDKMKKEYLVAYGKRSDDVQTILGRIKKEWIKNYVDFNTSKWSDLYSY